MRNFHFETLKHETLKCETFITSMFGGVYDCACHVGPSTKEVHRWYTKTQVLQVIVCKEKAFVNVTKKGEIF